MAGQVRLVAFDKTGTITEDGLAVVGVHPRSTRALVRDANSLAKIDNRIVIGMATCHDVKHLHPHRGAEVNGENDNSIKRGEMIGDPLEVKMVEWTGADVHDCVNAGVEVKLPNSDTRLAIVKVFEFVSALRRMAVVVNSKNDNHARVFVKGAPEAIEAICTPRSIPINYKAMVDDYAQSGLRVLALATRDLTAEEVDQLSNQSRSEMECDLEFLGFVVFENPVKPGSRPAIETLQSASIRCIMCTGDNLVTAVSVARKVRIIHPIERVYIPMVVPAKGVVAWVAHDDASDVLPGGLDQLQPGVTLAITGEAFDGLLHMGCLADINQILARGAVFARMAPDHKRILVEMLREKNNGEGIAFCGDGANDCAALKAADVGLSLSDAEASIAAPFTSAERDLGCVVTLIQEGRAALVTAHSCFKFMSCYSMCQFTSVCILYSVGSNLGDFQFLYIDIVLVLPLALAMARSEASKALSPIAPASRLVSKPILFTVISTMMLQIGMQLLTFYLTQAQPWYKPPVVDPETQVVACYEGTSLFLLSCLMYMAMAVCFAAGEPYRTSLIKNNVFVLVLVAVIIGTVALANVRNQGVMWFFDILELYDGWQWNVIALASVYAGVVLAIERVANTLLIRPASSYF